MVAVVRRHVGGGFIAVILSAFFFSTSGTFAKALLLTGWSPLAVVTIRVAGAAVLLLPSTLWMLRGRWHQVRAHLAIVLAYGFFAIGAAQFGYFAAVEHLDVGVALLIEYLGVVFVVLFIWARTRRTPHPYTLLGVVLAVSGLALVLDLTGSAPPNVVGILWALVAAIGMAGHFLLAARPTPVPTAAFAGLGLTVGTIILSTLGVIGLVPIRVGSGPVDLAGRQFPAWVAFAELCIVAAALAYLFAILGARRLGSTVASFVSLSEVLFAVLIAWLLLGESPGWMQIIGGILVLGGVVAVRIGEMRAAAALETAALATAALATAALETAALETAAELDAAGAVRLDPTEAWADPSLSQDVDHGAVDEIIEALSDPGPASVHAP